MTQDYKEILYINLFNVLQELTEHESPEVIFDRIVEDFAMSAEYHMGQADTFGTMLNTFRHNNPAETIPEEPETTYADTKTDYPVNWEAIEASLDPVNRSIMSGDQDNFLDFVKNIHFPDTLDS